MKQNQAGIQISRKSFFSSVIILLLLMLAAGILTLVVPAGQFERALTDGRETIVPGSFKLISGVQYPIWRWFTAPFEALWSKDAQTLWVILFFLLFIGGTFTILDKGGILRYSMETLVRRFGEQKYRLLVFMVLGFMLFGAVIGSFEEMIALVPLAITLAISLGWDSLIGLGMSLLASGFGFAAAITNPFTVSVAQKLAGLPAFSGVFYRVFVFIVIYAMLSVFLTRYAKKVEKDPQHSLVYQEDAPLRVKYAGRALRMGEVKPRVKQAAQVFGYFMLFILLIIFAGLFLPSLAAVSLPIIAVTFLVGGLVAGSRTGYASISMLFKDLLTGFAGILPAILLIMMAMSIKHIMTSGKTMDTILHYASQRLSGMSPYLAGVSIYALILLLEFFISSGSAKAFLVIPIIAPLVDMVGLTRQSAVLAFCFGDGFSNVLFPTNAALMIALGLTAVSYPKWFRWTIGLQLAVFAVTLLLLFGAIAMGYGPF
ncbi:MAG: YfcC family protein [Anaerolineaceae bacterium]|jgi:uncharacterized ion transporter superfamily protein YfcC